MRPTLESLMQGALNRDRRSDRPRPRCATRDALESAYTAYVQKDPLQAACWAASKAARLYAPANDTDTAKARANRIFRRLPAEGRAR